MIVIGVLVALAVDRWVAAIDQRGAERAALVALRDDFVRNREIALDKAESERALGAMGRQLLEALEAGDSEGDATKLFLAAELSGWHNPVSYRRGSWDDLQATLGVATLSDADLRMSVSEFFGNVESLRRAEDEWLNYILAFREEAGRHLPAEYRVRVVDWFGSLPSWAPAQWSAAPEVVEGAAVLSSMSASPELRAKLVDVIQARGGSVALHSESASQIEELIQMMNRALAAL